jgi:carbon-monoxide dehydrogenase medium subunit
MKATEFLVDVMFTSLEQGELLVEVQVPKLSTDSRSAYARLARVEGSFALVNAAAVVDGGRPVIAIGGATAVPVIVDTSVDLSGGASAGALDEIGEAAFRACEDAHGDLHASPEYRRELARVYAKRAVQQALAAG